MNGASAQQSDHVPAPEDAPGAWAPGDTGVLRLPDDQLDTLADLIAARLTRAPHGRTPSGRRLVDAQTLAGELGCSRDCVYAHAEELGGRRIGDGPRGRLRFDLDRALEAWTSCVAGRRSEAAKEPAVRGRSRRRKRREVGSNAPLLPIRGPVAADGLLDAATGRR
jgi:hypothetical protein